MSCFSDVSPVAKTALFVFYEEARLKKKLIPTYGDELIFYYTLFILLKHAFLQQSK